MAIDFEQSPYWDDFNANKNYLRILFRPGRAVQAREVTQLQTALSNQLSNLGDHILKDGTPVTDAKIKINFEQPVFIVDAVDRSNNPIIIGEFLGKKIRGATSLATGIVSYIDETTRTMYVNYRGGKFVDNEELDVYYDPSEPAGPSLDAQITAGSITTGVFANQESGIYYVSGNFVYVDPQGIPVDDLGNEGSYKVGFIFNESIITSDDDASLFDNAVGTPNQTAPGADRYNGEIQLQVYKVPNGQTLDDLILDDEFHEVVVIRDGQIIKENNTVQYSKILDTIARRTFDESGNYTVREFPLQVTEYKSDEPSEQATLDDYFTIGVEAGKGYVQGYEVETIASSYVKVPRSRNTESVNNETIYPNIGPWLETGLNSSLPNNDGGNGRMINFTEREPVLLKSGATVINPNTPVTVITVISNSNDTRRVYLQGVGSMLSLLPSVTRIEQANDSTRFIDVNTARGINGTGESAPIFPVQNDTVESIALNETTYDTIRYRKLDKSGSTFTVIADTTTVDYPPTGTIINMNTVVGGTRLVEGNDYTVVVDNASAPSRFTITLSATYSTITEIDVVYKQTKTQANHRTKTLTTFNALFSDSVAGLKTLQHSDIYDIVSVSKNGSPVSGTELDLILLDNGQNDYYYDYGKLSGLEDGESYDIVYRYFEHGADGDYFSVNSYTSVANLALISDIYKTIPVYQSASGTGTFFLSDCLDFRRSVTQLSGGVAEMVVPQSSIRLDYNYYVGRKDKVYIDKNGGVGVQQGIPSKFPESPIEVDDTMLLFKLTIPAYTFEPKDIDIEKVTNKRYTMRDIGNIEKRLDTLEYFTSLSLLETETNKLTITDASGNDKFKTGILVDNFSGHSVGDVKHPEYRIAIDGTNGILRTPYYMESFDLETVPGSSTNIKFHDHIATLDYTTVPWINQPLGSTFSNVNPYSVFQWIGNITLTPSTDNWIDVKRTPDVTVNFEGANDNLKQSVKLLEDSGVIGTNWNAWQTAWTGEPVRTGSFTTNTGTSPWQTVGTFTGGRSGRTTDIQTRNVVTRTTDRFTQPISERRSGTQMGVIPGKTTENIGEFIVDTSIIPWMRSKEVNFNATGMKPNTVLNATFDGVNVTVDCKPEGSSYGDPLLTDDAGLIKGTFLIPNDTDKRFRTGSRNFRLTDDITTPETSGNASYVASGMLQTKQNTIISMDNPQIAPISVEDTRVRTTSFQNSTTNIATQKRRTSWKDPLAQSFLVSEDTGVFLTSVELYFKTKDNTLPVSVYIVEMSNGYPTQNIIPYSEVTMIPDDVNIDTQGLVGTDFEFSDPVYLSASSEYAFVVISNSNQYECTIAAVGGTDLGTGLIISKQPYAGSMFKSQNSSTWTADQEHDLKFKLNRAQFNTSLGTLSMQNIDFDTVADLGLNYSIDMTTAMLNVDGLNFSGTNLSHAMKMRSGDFASSFIGVDNKLNYEMGQVAEITQPIAEGRPLLTESHLNTVTDYISPVVSMTRKSMVGVSNLVNGTDAGRYISRTVSLDNPSDDIKVYLDVLEPDQNTEVKVYFKTEQYIPRYVDTIGTLPVSLKGEQMQVVWYDNGTELAIKQGTLNVTNVETNKMYVGQVTNSDAFRNASGSNALPVTATNVYAINETTEITEIKTFVLSTAYNFGEYVFSSGSLYKALDNVSIADAANPPSPSTLWQLIPFIETTGEIQEGGIEEWREMEKVTDVPTSNTGFTETEFIPVNALDNEFSSFSVRIDFVATNKAITPFAKNLRALALY